MPTGPANNADDRPGPGAGQGTRRRTRGSGASASWAAHSIRSTTGTSWRPARSPRSSTSTRWCSYRPGSRGRRRTARCRLRGPLPDDGHRDRREPQFSVSRIDIDRGGPTYTTDTLRDLRSLNPDTDLFFITGADALGQILTWRDADELFSLAHFIGVTRPGHTLTDPGLPEGGVSLVEVPALAISSTDCRARVAKGDPVWYLVPDGVVRYIDKRELYRGE